MLASSLTTETYAGREVWGREVRGALAGMSGGHFTCPLGATGPRTISDDPDISLSKGEGVLYPNEPLGSICRPWSL